MVKKTFLIFILVAAVSQNAVSQIVIHDTLAQAQDTIITKDGGKISGYILQIDRTTKSDLVTGKIISQIIQTVKIKQAKTNLEFDVDWEDIARLTTSKSIDVLEVGERSNAFTSYVKEVFSRRGDMQTYPFHFKIGNGFTIASLRQYLGMTTLDVFRYSTFRQTGYNGSYGCGSKLYIGANVMFTKYVGIDLSIQKISNSKSVNSSVEYTPSMFYTSSIFLSFSPSHIFTPYVKFGLTITKPGFVSNRVVNYYANNNIFQAKIEETPSWAIGYSGALGTSISLFPHVRTYLEMSYLNLVFRPEKGELQKLTYEGGDFMYRFPTKESRVIKYADDIQLAQIGTLLRPTYPFNTIDFTIGLELEF